MWTIVVILFLVACAGACPFYQNIPGPDASPTTNYTRLSAAMVAAMSGPDLAVTVVVCDGAEVFADEVLPVITTGLTIAGESGTRGAPFSYLKINNANLANVFQVNAINGFVVTFERLAIVAQNQTLFSVQGGAQLVLQDVKCEFAFTCVYVATDPTPGPATSGLSADTAWFVGTRVGILHSQGYVSCTHCTFEDIFESAMVTRLHVYDPYVYFSLYDVHYVNDLYQIAYQAAPRASLVPPEFSAAYVDRTLVTNTQTYSRALTATELWGAEGCETCPTCSSSQPCYSEIVNVTLVVLLAIAIAACVITCIFRQKTSKGNV